MNLDPATERIVQDCRQRKTRAILLFRSKDEYDLWVACNRNSIPFDWLKTEGGIEKYVKTWLMPRLKTQGSKKFGEWGKLEFMRKWIKPLNIQEPAVFYESDITHEKMLELKRTYNLQDWEILKGYCPFCRFSGEYEFNRGMRVINPKYEQGTYPMGGILVKCICERL